MLDAKSKTNLRRSMLKWFDANQRDLPWRKRKTPYRIWVSEIMLQQTQVATVIGYYQRFIEQFPNVKALASAEQSEVLKLWEGLGYYRRARQMHAAAQIVVDEHGGKFPTDFDSVLALPGIGRYTAGAILSISMDQKLPILEGNTVRLFSRLMKLEEDPKISASQKALWKFSESLLSQNRVGDFNQSLMELGSGVCKPKSPDCPNCPIIKYCGSFQAGKQHEIPNPSRKMKYEDVREAVVLVAKPSFESLRHKLLVRKCKAGERWAGLWDFPRFSLDEIQNAEGQGSEIVESGLAEKLKQLTGYTGVISKLDLKIKHAVTKFRIELSCYRVESRTGRLRNNSTETFLWATLENLKELPMSVTGRKIADWLDR